MLRLTLNALFACGLHAAFACIQYVTAKWKPR